LINCEQVQEMLDAYALGAAEAADASAIEEHVGDCVRCWEELTRHNGRRRCWR
jgi:anti-sigma factor RsiW